jgi:hypothetical protein
VPTALPGGAADAACAVFLSYRGAPYFGTAGEPGPGDLGRPAGTGIVPGCNDVIVIGPGAPPPAPDVTVPLRRVAGVLPRHAVAMRLGAGHALMIRDGVGCARPTLAGRLACLRAASARFLRGPSLVAPISAWQGAAVRLSVRLPGRPARPPSGTVVLRPATGGPAPAPLVRSGGVVVIPDVEPGEYRLVAVTGGGTGGRGLAARITVR